MDLNVCIIDKSSDEHVISKISGHDAVDGDKISDGEEVSDDVSGPSFSATKFQIRKSCSWHWFPKW